ncbi:MAG TPA: mannose-6-phosphate isomerase, class I [Actinoplanes sp.]
MSVYPLTGVVRPYAWGSRTILAKLQGRPVPSDGPEAELWLGAHPGDPSTVSRPDGPISLATLIAEDPKGQLGSEVAGEFGSRLPYLMKVLAAEAPLSLQAHPDAEYARRAFAAQEADPAAPRNYTDPFHKPEMLVALTPFRALCGFRAPEMSAAVLDELDLPRLAPVVAALRAGVPGLRDAVRTLLAWPTEDRRPLVDAVVAAARSRPTSSYALAAELAGHYPGDPGVLVALLLNHVRLEPGEAIWMPAGNMHAYLNGAAVEIMASSDNVLRGGFTPKRVDVDELLRVLRFEVLDEPVLPAVEVASGVVTWEVPAREFALYRIRLDGATQPIVVPGQGPRILIGTEGDVEISADDGGSVRVRTGAAAFAPADAGTITVAGGGEVFVATVPE